jgi:hypothetical protein
LLSLSTITRQNYRLTFNKANCYIYNSNKSLLAKGSYKDRVPVFSATSSIYKSLPLRSSNNTRAILNTSSTSNSTKNSELSNKEASITNYKLSNRKVDDKKDKTTYKDKKVVTKEQALDRLESYKAIKSKNRLESYKANKSKNKIQSYKAIESKDRLESKLNNSLELSKNSYSLHNLNYLDYILGLQSLSQSLLYTRSSIILDSKDRRGVLDSKDYKPKIFTSTTTLYRDYYYTIA